MTLNSTNSDVPTRVNDLFDPDHCTKQPNLKGKDKRSDGRNLEKPSNIDALYLDLMSPEWEIFGTGVTVGRQAHVNRAP